MAEQSLWQRVIAAIEGEYERRIRRASLVSEYGAAQHGHGDYADGSQAAPEASADEEATIVNIPKGTPVARSAQHAPHSDHPPAQS